MLLHQWLDHLAYSFWVITVSYYAAHQVQSHQVNTQYHKTPSVFGVFPVLASNTCSCLLFSIASIWVPSSFCPMCSVLARLVYQVCLLASFSPHACLMKRKQWDLAYKKLRYLKMLTYYSAWMYSILYCHVLLFSYYSHHLYVYQHHLWRGPLRAVDHFMHASKLNICTEFLLLHQCLVYLDDTTRGISPIPMFAPHQCKSFG